MGELQYAQTSGATSILILSFFMVTKVNKILIHLVRPPPPIKNCVIPTLKRGIRQPFLAINFLASDCLIYGETMVYAW